MARGQTYLAPSGSQIKPFEEYGFPGKYHSTIKYTTGQLDLTGSNFGYGAVMVITAGSATLHSGNTTIASGDLTAKQIYDITLSKISGGTGASIYLFKRQQ
jgi:hypothetical protein